MIGEDRGVSPGCKQDSGARVPICPLTPVPQLEKPSAGTFGSGKCVCSGFWNASLSDSTGLFPSLSLSATESDCLHDARHRKKRPIARSQYVYRSQEDLCRKTNLCSIRCIPKTSVKGRDIVTCSTNTPGLPGLLGGFVWGSL